MGQSRIDKLFAQEPFYRLTNGSPDTRAIMALQRDSNYLFGHGSYCTEWYCSEPGEMGEPEERSVFERVMQLTDNTVRHMIAERIAGVDAAELGGMMNYQARSDAQWLEIKPQFWMVPANKEFVLISSDGYRWCHGIYRHDYRNYLIRGERSRILKYVESHHGNERLIRALEGNFT